MVSKQTQTQKKQKTKETISYYYKVIYDTAAALYENEVCESSNSDRLLPIRRCNALP